MTQSLFTTVTSRAELDEFLVNYPRRELIFKVDHCTEPPLVTYNDPALGVYPKGIVASYWHYSNDPDSPIYEKNPSFRVRTEFMKRG